MQYVNMQYYRNMLIEINNIMYKYAVNLYHYNDNDITLHCMNAHTYIDSDIIMHTHYYMLRMIKYNVL